MTTPSPIDEETVALLARRAGIDLPPERRAEVAAILTTVAEDVARWQELPLDDVAPSLSFSPGWR